MQDTGIQSLLSSNPRLHGVVLDAGISVEGLTSATLCDALIDRWAQGSASIDVWTNRIIALMEAEATRDQAQRVADIRNGGKLNICLNMIVKNEAHVILRCLESVKPHIHSWCIVDTGSTDGTQELILEALKGIPGRLHERAWVDFGTNRNQAFELAREEAPTHLMFIDADETLEGPIETPMLAGDGYFINVHHAGQIGRRFWIVREDYPGRWVGTIHEDLESAGLLQLEERAYIQSHADGARSLDHKKRDESDIDLLFDRLAKDSTDARAWFYLGEIYFRTGRLAEAREAYESHKAIGTDEAEVSIVKDRLEKIQSFLGESHV